jgi:hypothetical protein
MPGADKTEVNAKQILALWDAGNGEALYAHCSEYSKSAAADSSSYCRKPKAEFVKAVHAEAARCGPVVSIREEKPGQGSFERTAVHQSCPGKVQFVRILFMQTDGGGDIQALTTNEFAEGTPGAGRPGGSSGLGAGEIFAGFLALVVVLAISIVAIVIIRARQASQGRAWEQTARALGLALEMPPGGNPSGVGFGLVMRGAMHGATVTAAVATHRGPDPLTGAQSVSYSTICRAYFRAPLGMRLALVPQSLVGQFVAGVMGTQVISTGMPDFDRAFRLTAADPQRAVPLVGRIAQDVMRTSMLGKLSVTDEYVAIETGGIATDPAALGRTLDGAAMLVRRIEG